MHDYLGSVWEAVTLQNGIKSNEVKVYLNSYLVHARTGVDDLLSHVQSRYLAIKDR